jgi:hypothetical protein
MKLALYPPSAQFMTAVSFLNTILTFFLFHLIFGSEYFVLTKKVTIRVTVPVILPSNLYLALFHFLKQTYAYQITVLFVYVRVFSFQLMNQLTKFHETLYERNVFEEHFSALFFSFPRLRHYATSRKVTGSSPDEVEFFHPSSRTMVLGSTQPLTEMSTRNLPGG